MTHADAHLRPNPEDRFDHWLDGFVAGTPAGAASLNGTDGSLGRAMSGARQLHGLAAGASPAAAAQRRIEEDLMRSGTLAAPRGTTWIPIEKETRRAPWWSPTSPVIAAALVVALIVALGASFIATQRPAQAPTPAPGFAMASPEATATPATSDSDMFIVWGMPAEEVHRYGDHVGVIDGDTLTIFHPNAEPIVLHSVNEVVPTGEPGQAMVIWNDGSRAVIDVMTGETLFELPDEAESESYAGSYLLVSESGENADWTIYDLRTGESRALSEIVNLPADPPVIVTLSGQLPTDSPTVLMQFLTEERDPLNPGEYPSFLIAGSLDRIVTLDGYPPAGEERTSAPLVSRDGTRATWIAPDPENAIVIADTTTGDELARIPIEKFHASPEIGGFTADGEHLVVLTHASAFLVGWTDGEPDIQVIADTTGYAFNPLFYAPASALYYQQGESLLRMTIPEGDITTILDDVSLSYGPMFTAPGSPWIAVNVSSDTMLINASTGKIVSHLRDTPPHEAPLGELSVSTSNGGSTVLQSGGSESGYLVSPQYPNGLVLAAPIDRDAIAASVSPDGVPVHYTLSPDGGSVVAGTVFADGQGFDPRFIAPINPNPKWTPIDDGVTTVYWIPMPASDDATDAVTLPAQDFATPAASEPETEHVTSFAITAKDDIFVSITVDGLPVFEGDLQAGQSTETFTGSEFEVYTTSGENTLFTNSCSTPPFNMGYEPGEAYYILKADAASCPPEASPAASPAEGASCAATPPNGDVPPGENADLDWLGSGTENPSLWLMMTWDHGRLETNQVADGYPVKLTFWRGEGSGEIDVTATGPDGETLPSGTFEAFQGDPIPGLHPYGGTLPVAGCWTFTTTDGNDTLTWTVDVQSIEANSSGALMVVEGTSGEARFENGVRIATLGDDGLTLPIEPGVNVALPEVTQIRTIWGHRDTLHVIREDGTEAVIDLATGDVLFEVEPFQNWTREFGRWHFVPTDDTLTDWTVTDLTTGDTRLLSELIDLPGDTAVMPSTPPEIFPGDTQVFQLELGTPETTGWVTTDPAARTFVIAGSLDRVTPLPDYPTHRDNVGSPALVASADGDVVAYETRAGDSRIVVLDVTSGRVLARYSTSEIGENPALAGFSGDSRDLIVTTDDGRVIQLAPDGQQPMSLHDGLEGIDNPLLFRDGSLLYVRQVDKLLMIEMLPDGFVREVSTGLLPSPFDFTTPRGNWIVFPTRDRMMMLDATTGMIVSQTWYPGFGPGPAEAERRPGWVDGDGDTYILGMQAMSVPPDVPTSQPTAWILSRDFPEGLEMTAPEGAGNYWLSPDGTTLYAYTSELSNGPGTIWSTPLGDDPNWQVVVEDVTPLPNPVMFYPEG